MKDDIFGSDFARAYDLWYRQKDYEAECDLIERVFEKFGAIKVRSILDLGCGTGGHAIPLARRGYRVTGVDRSEAMLSIAAEKATAEVWREGTMPPSFIHAEMQELDLGQTFDAVIMMFAVLGYQRSNDELAQALAAVRRHLAPGGVFTGDVWYGPAVLTIRPSDRVRVIHVGETELVRTAEVSIDAQRHLCSVHYTMWEMSGRKLATRQEEEHLMRYFFPLELEYFMQTSGLQSVGLFPMTEIEAQPSEATWNVIFCARVGPE